MSAHRDNTLTTTTNPAYEMMKQRGGAGGEGGRGVVREKEEEGVYDNISDQ